MKRVYVNLTDVQAAKLKEIARVTGVLVAEQIRRAVDDLPSIELIETIRKADGARKASIYKLLEKEPELAVHFPGYLPEQKASAEQALFSEQKATE